MIPGWLLHGDLPPAGNRIVLSHDENAPPEFAAYRSHWTQSGTAALALGMMAARAQRPEVQNPSVILPAYGCPDLVAAAVYAGVTPLLVDICADDPGYDLQCLSQAIDKNTVAVVAVNFLGIRERLDAIRAILAAHPAVLLIEDNAQWFPEPLHAPGLVGDLVCLSFGRGKPVSLLGGGVLLSREGLQFDFSASIGAARSEGAALRHQATLFNLLLQPRCYWLVNRNSFIELGRTVFKPLAQIRAMDTARMQSLSSAAAAHLQHSRRLEQAWTDVVAKLPQVKNIDAAERRGRLLRFPVLCRDSGERNRLWRALDRAGLGATAMYQSALPDIAGVKGRVTIWRGHDNAARFAARLLTLPAHTGVTFDAIERAAAILADVNTHTI